MISIGDFIRDKGRNKSLISIYGAVILCMAFLAAVFTGCAGTGGLRNMSSVSKYFDNNADVVWEAVLQAAEGMPIKTKDKEKGILETQWIKGWSKTRTSGLVLEGRWQARYCLFVQVTGGQGKTYVSVYSLCEEKAPGGSRAYRWERTASDGENEQAFLTKLEGILNNS
ncbi:MAG: hypothetical protein HW390_1151 [Candidatus Brocadiaceae bacterium]|nr:hypothetical protein [Candidatus Brocadiaceae bacterium]